MRNRRFIIFFAVGSAVMIAVLAWLSRHERFAAAMETRASLSSIPPDALDSIEIRHASGAAVAVERRGGGKWRVSAPFDADTDDAAMARLVDAFSLTVPGDAASDRDLRALGRSPADFGLEPPAAEVCLSGGGRRERFAIGSKTPSGGERYVKIGGVAKIFTVPAGVMDAVPGDVQSIRCRRLVAMDPSAVSEISFRIPGAPFAKFAKRGPVWRMVQPDDAPVRQNAVESLVRTLASARVSGYVWPVDGEGGKADLETYGLGEDAKATIVLSASSGKAESVSLGAASSTNLAYVLVRSGAAIAVADAAAFAPALAGEASFRDRRVFPVSSGEIVSVAVARDGAETCVLSRDAVGAWRIESPVSAPADQTAAGHLVDGLLHLETDGLAESGIRVEVRTAATNFPAVSVPEQAAGGLGSFASLRDRTMLEIDPSSIRAMTAVFSSGETVAVRHDREKGAWRLVRQQGEAGAKNVNADAAERLAKALARVEAARVETLSAARSDMQRCSLDRPLLTLSVDVADADTVRRTLVIGGATPEGGRYAMVGGADSIFALSGGTVAVLIAPLAE